MIPLVSIVIPVYNQKSSFLIQCIESAINQTYNNLEILISNNHSTNGCDKVIDEYSLKDSRIKVIKPSIHVNMTDHFNYAGNKAKGKYISFLSSDDFLEPDCINKLMEILIQNPKVAMGYCNNNMLDDSTNVSTPIRNNSFKTGIYSPKILSDRFYNYTEYWIIGGIFKREIFIENNFSEQTKYYGMDIFFAYKLMSNKISVLHIENRIYHLGLDQNAFFFDKCLLSVKSRQETLLDKPGIEKINSLINYYKKIDKLKMKSIISLFFKLVKPILKRLILSKNPSLFCLDIYRLGYMCTLK